MHYQVMINELQEVFFGMLERKTSWGRNELKDLWKDAVIVVAARRLDEGGD